MTELSQRHPMTTIYYPQNHHFRINFKYQKQIESTTDYNKFEDSREINVGEDLDRKSNCSFSYGIPGVITNFTVMYRMELQCMYILNSVIFRN